MPTAATFALGLLLAIIIAGGGYLLHALSKSGALGAVVIGALVFGLGGLPWAALLVTFFASSSLLSHYRVREKSSAAEKFAKSGRRDLGQVLANGGLGAILVVLSVVQPGLGVLLFVAYAGAMAAVNADTWATELGVLNPRPPRLITNGRAVAVGTSGAVSALGVAATAAGAGLIGLTAAILPVAGAAGLERRLLLILVATLAGVAGSLADSLLGATVQGVYWCPRDSKETEKRIHGCGERTRLLRGWAWLDNEWVNVVCSLVGAAVATGLWRLAAG